MKNNFSLVLALAVSFALLPASAAPSKSAGSTNLKSAPPLSKSAGSTSVLLSDNAMDKELVVLENRFFFHHYSYDPVEKRLERLELMTLGGNQFGTSAERLANLKAAIVQRDKQSAQLMAAQKSKSDGPAKYPVLSTLEWRVLKKTYTNETIDERLNRLESSLFGVPAQSMSYLDRIERLKTTAGIGSDSTIAAGRPESLTERGVGPYTPLKRGPMPRAGIGSGSLFGNLTENGTPFSRSPFAGSATTDSIFGDADLAKEFEGGMDYGAFSDKILPNVGDIGSAGRARGWAGQEILIRIGPDGTSRTVRNFGPGSTTSGQPEVSDNVLEQMQKPMLDFLRQLGLPFGSLGRPGLSSPVPFEMPAPMSERAPEKGSESNSGLLVPKLNKRPTSREELPPYSDPNSI